MSWPLIKLIGGGVIVAFLLWAVADRFKLAARVERYEQCEAAAKSVDRRTDPCDPAVALVIESARRADACDAALAVEATDAGAAYRVLMSCTEQVKRAVAARDAARREAENLRVTMAAQRADQDAAIARAEARGTTQANRKADNEQTIKAAPRDGNGRVACDADCVRRLAGDPAKAGR